MQRLRNKALNKYRENKTQASWNYYKQLRNLTTASIRSEKKAYLNYKFRVSNPQQKWKELHKLNVSGKIKANIPQNLSNVEELNTFFTEISKRANNPDPDLLSFYANNKLTNNRFAFSLIDENLVLQILKNIKTKAFGVDQLNITLILLACPAILKPLIHILNFCIEKSYFPLKWKQANVIPIPKTNKPTEYGHLRSISILPTFSKVLEKIMESQISTFLQNNNLLPTKQSGFRPGYSCSGALSEVTDDIFRTLDAGKACLLVMLDFTKAFDMVNHKILISILHFVGFADAATDLVSSFLFGRSQRVILGGKTSSFLNVVSGVPQGSILGPILYCVYTSQFEKSLKFCKNHMYADDTQLYLSFNPSEIENANICINADLDSLLHQTNSHLLKINPSKSIAVLFCNENLRINIMTRLNIMLEDRTIRVEKQAKNLGLILDNKLRFKEHVTNKLKICYSRLKIVYSQRRCLSPEIKKMLCESLVLSPLNYCDNVYGPCLDTSDIQRIQKLQNCCLRMIFGIRRRQHISHKLKETGWLNMHNRRILHAICFYYRVLKFKCPPYLLTRVVFRTDVHNINIRRKNLLTIPSHNKEYFKRSFSYQIAFLMNKYNILDFSHSVPSFKKKLKIRIFAQQ